MASVVMIRDNTGRGWIETFLASKGSKFSNKTSDLIKYFLLYCVNGSSPYSIQGINIFEKKCCLGSDKPRVKNQKVEKILKLQTENANALNLGSQLLNQY